MTTHPYDVADAERVLRDAGLLDPQTVAAWFPVRTASHVIWDRVTNLPPEHRASLDPEAGEFANVLWRLLRTVDLVEPTDVAYDGIIDDDREPTLTDAMTLLVARGAVLPREVPAFAKALRAFDLPGMADAIERARAA